MDFVKLFWCIICVLISLLLSVIANCGDTNDKIIKGGNEKYSNNLSSDIHKYALYLLNDDILEKEDNEIENERYIKGAGVLKKDVNNINETNNTDCNNIVVDSIYSTIPKCIDSTSTFLDNYKPNHVWYKYNTWRSLFSNEKDKAKYLDDINVAYYKFYFNWQPVFEKVIPYVKYEPKEAIGIIRCKNDGKTLYIEEMEVCNHFRKLNKNSTYIATIHTSLVSKYFDKPCYFVFHTHPKGTGDPWPSDNDIEILLNYNYYNRHLGHVVISEYGAIIYFLNKTVLKELKEKGLLTFYTYCHDLLSAWNSFTFSTFNIKNSDIIDIMFKFGLHIIIIPSPAYISDSYRFNRTGSILVGRFIHDRDRVIVILRNKIKELEKKEKKKKIMN